MSTHIKHDSLFIELIRIYGLLLIFFIGFLFHIIIHEAGHLIFGLITGYSFVSFRIGSFTVVKEDGKLKAKKFNIPGTAGQCLMMPPDLIDGKFPFVIYNFGGVIINFIVSTLSILSVIFIKNIIFPFNAILVLTGMAGIIAVLTNGIPLKIGGIVNDAYNVISMLKDEEAKRGFYLQLKVNGLQSKGMRIKDMDFSLFELQPDSDISNPLNTSIRLMEFNWHLDNMDFDNARKCINSFIPHFSKLIPLYRFEINCERIFLELIGECDKSFIDRLYDKQLKKYIKSAKYMISKKRLLMAYEYFYNENSDHALKHYEDLKKLSNSYPIRGEADMELMLGSWIKERITT
ncbi:MAG: hypothetical protein RIN63_12490 [Tissierella sp.]|nr:hypothetical protein [Tissierella sp.]